MNLSIAPSGRCTARVQYLSKRKEIQKLLLEGFSRRAIFNSFTDQEIFTMTYQAFCKYIRNDKLILFREKIESTLNKNIENHNASKVPTRIIESEGDSFAKGTYDSRELY